MVKRFVVDDAGAIVKIIIPAGEAGAGSYLVTWNGHGDALALWRIEASGSLTLANSFAYSTWGTPTIATHNGVADLEFRFLYLGKSDVHWDNAHGLALQYMHARHYSPTVGRFLQPDPVADESNLYVYAENSPVSRLDPNGTMHLRHIGGCGCGGGGGGYTATDTRALIALARMVRYRTITYREAKILNSWRMEYGVRGHGPKFDLRHQKWGYHMTIRGTHLKVQGKELPL